MEEKCPEKNNSELFFDLYPGNSGELNSFNSEIIYEKSEQNISSSKYIFFNIYN